jgi:putative transcriptional regulator
MLKLIVMLKNNLSKIMGEKRIRIVELHRMTGLSQPTIINLYYEKTKSVHFDTIDKICTALEISVGELFEHVPK